MKRRTLKAIKLKKHSKFERHGTPTLIEIPFNELLTMYNNLTTDASAELNHWRATPKSRDNVLDTVRRWETETGFYGGTTEDMKRYIKNGYRTGSVLGTFLPGVLRTRDGSAQRGRWQWMESGDEIDVGLALSGDAAPFRSFEPAPTAGGMNIRALYSFSANVDHNVIAAYGAWIARLLATCNGAGVSPALTIDQYGERLTSSHRSLVLIRLRVKQENEALDWHRYSCLFSPTGYRHLGFTALMYAGGSNLLPGTLASGLGGCVSDHEWDLDWEPVTRTLTISAPSYANEFPSDKLTEQLIETGALNPQGAMV